MRVFDDSNVFAGKVELDSIMDWVFVAGNCCCTHATEQYRDNVNISWPLPESMHMYIYDAKTLLSRSSAAQAVSFCMQDAPAALKSSEIGLANEKSHQCIVDSKVDMPPDCITVVRWSEVGMEEVRLERRYYGHPL